MSKAIALLGLVMSLFFMGMGCALAFYPPESLIQSWPAYSQYILGFLVFVYGAFRFYRSVRLLKRF